MYRMAEKVSLSLVPRGGMQALSSGWASERPEGARGGGSHGRGAAAPLAHGAEGSVWLLSPFPALLVLIWGGGVTTGTSQQNLGLEE